MRIGFYILILSSLIACGQFGGMNKPKLEFEVVGVREQALEALAATPLEFELLPSEDDESWERAHIFLSKYTDKYRLTNIQGDLVLNSSPQAGERYSYRVSKHYNGTAYQYNVDCIPNQAGQGTSGFEIAPNAQRNAKNLARFIKDGQLEVSLLER